MKQCHLFVYVEHGGHHGHSHGIAHSNNKLAQLANTDDNENNSFVYGEGVCIQMAFVFNFILNKFYAHIHSLFSFLFLFLLN